MVGQVALVCTSNHKEGVSRVIKLLQANPIQGKMVTIKPNFNTADPFPASTHNDTLFTLVSTLKEMGADRIVLAERSGPANTNDVMKQKGIFDMSLQLGFEAINLDELGPDGWVHLNTKNSHWSNGFNFARVYAEAECVVQTCCLKTHRYGGHFTMSLKNSVGMVDRSYMSELHSSPDQRKMIAEINTGYMPSLIIMDGIEAFVRGGPMEGVKVDARVMLASNDRVAIDAVGVALLRLLGTTPEVSQGPIFQQDQIARAVQLGLGLQSAADIVFVTGEAKSEELAGKLESLLR